MQLQLEESFDIADTILDSVADGSLSNCKDQQLNVLINSHLVIGRNFFGDLNVQINFGQKARHLGENTPLIINLLFRISKRLNIFMAISRLHFALLKFVDGGLVSQEFVDFAFCLA